MNHAVISSWRIPRVAFGDPSRSPYGELGMTVGLGDTFILARVIRVRGGTALRPELWSTTSFHISSFRQHSRGSCPSQRRRSCCHGALQTKPPWAKQEPAGRGPSVLPSLASPALVAKRQACNGRHRAVGLEDRAHQRKRPCVTPAPDPSTKLSALLHMGWSQVSDATPLNSCSPRLRDKVVVLNGATRNPDATDNFARPVLNGNASGESNQSSIGMLDVVQGTPRL